MVANETKFSELLTAYNVSDFTRNADATHPILQFGIYNNNVLLNDILNKLIEGIIKTGDSVQVDWDEIAATYPDDVTEVYTYKLATVTVLTMTVVYVDSCKEEIVSVVKS